MRPDSSRSSILFQGLARVLVFDLRFARCVSVPRTQYSTAPGYFILESIACSTFTHLRTDKASSVCCCLSTTKHRTTKMANQKQQVLQNLFKLHDIKLTNSSNYLASQLDLNSTPTQLNEILAALKTVASKLENLAEQLSAHMSLDDLEPYLQKSADASILVLHYADKKALDNYKETMFLSVAIWQTHIQDLIATLKKKRHDDHHKLSTTQINRILLPFHMTTRMPTFSL